MRTQGVMMFLIKQVMQKILFIISFFLYLPIMLTNELMGGMSQDHALFPLWYHPEYTTEKAEGYYQSYRTICNQLGATENLKIQENNKNTLRIMTYNVHFWTHPVYKKNVFYQILEVMNYLAPDIMLLQEVGEEDDPTNDHKFEKICAENGYTTAVYCRTGTGLRNYILAKSHLRVTELSRGYYQANPTLTTKHHVRNRLTKVSHDQEQRCFVRMVIELPGGKKLAAYCTHLEVRGITRNGKKILPGQVRFLQVQELLAVIKKYDADKMVIVGLDTNSVRQEDMLKSVGSQTLWKLYLDRAEKIFGQTKDAQFLVDTRALGLFKKAGFIESFAAARVAEPLFTSMYGTRIDFLFMNEAARALINNSSVLYAHVSDHVPLIADLSLKKPLKKSKEPVSDYRALMPQELPTVFYDQYDHHQYNKINTSK